MPSGRNRDGRTLNIEVRKTYPGNTVASGLREKSSSCKAKIAAHQYKKAQFHQMRKQENIKNEIAINIIKAIRYERPDFFNVKIDLSKN